MDIGHGLFVEQTVSRGVIADKSFESYPFLVITLGKSSTALKTTLNFIKTAISGQTKVYLAIFTAFEWATEYITHANNQANLAIGRIPGNEILKLACTVPALDGGLIVNFGVKHQSCLAKNLVITKEEIMKICNENV